MITIGKKTNRRNLKLPVDVATETFAVLGKRGAGKTYMACVLCEELLANDIQVVIVDPLDVCWGLRSSATGKGEGFPIHVFGGEHGDIGLEPTSGELMAEIIVELGISCVLSLDHMSKAKQRSFMTKFAQQLYYLKGQQKNRSPLHLVIDEADLYAPQRIMAGDGPRLFGAIDDIVRRGRSRGMGVTLISQRPAVINKDVLTQTEILVALKVTSPQDRSALNAWIEQHDTKCQRAKFLASLADLPVGTAWIWSPGMDVFDRIAVRERTTFDSSSTPKVGDRPAKPAKMARVNLNDLESRMAATIESTKANDPRELRKTIAKLKRQLNDQATPIDPRQLDAEYQRGRDSAIAEMRKQISGWQLDLSRISDEMNQSRVSNDSSSQVGLRPKITKSPDIKQPTTHSSSFGGGKRRMLIALAEYPNGLSGSRLALLSDVKLTGGSFRTYTGQLRSMGLIDGDRQRFVITAAGIVEAGDFDPLPTGQGLIAYWQEKLGNSGKRRMFDALVSAHPAPLSSQELGDRSNVDVGGGSFRTYLGYLRGLNLIQGSPAAITLSDELIEDY